MSLSGLAVITIVWFNPPEASGTLIEWGCGWRVGKLFTEQFEATIDVGPHKCLRLYALGSESSEPTEVYLGRPEAPTNLTVQ